jgi:hypothetical protein
VIITKARERPLMAATFRTLAWRELLPAIVLAVGCAGLLAVLPPVADRGLPLVAVVVLTCGLAAAVGEEGAEITVSLPVPARTRLLLRCLLAAAVNTAGLVTVLLIADQAGARPQTGHLLGAWATLCVLSVALATAAGRLGIELPGPAVAAAVLGGGLVVLGLLPAQTLALLPDSAAVRALAGLAVGALGLTWGTRDPAAPRLRTPTPPRRGEQT